MTETVSNREVKTADVGNHKIVHKTYVSGREFNEIQACYMVGVKVSGVGGGKAVSVDGFNPNAETEATKKMIEMLVVSLDGNPENVVDRILDLPNEEYQQVVAVLAEITGKKKST